MSNHPWHRLRTQNLRRGPGIAVEHQVPLAMDPGRRFAGRPAVSISLVPPDPGTNSEGGRKESE